MPYYIAQGELFGLVQTIPLDPWARMEVASGLLDAFSSSFPRICMASIALTYESICEYILLYTYIYSTDDYIIQIVHACNTCVITRIVAGEVSNSIRLPSK